MRRNDWLVGQLPMGMLDDDFFIRFTRIFQELATTLLDGADNVPNVVDVSVAPDAMVRWLGSWIGVESIDSSLPDATQRRIVSESAQILAWRGTRRGLMQFLELVSGAPAEVTDSGGIFVAGEAGLRPPHVHIRVASTGWVPEADFLSIVEDELPANVTFELFVGDRQLWPPKTIAPEPAGETIAGEAVGGASSDGAVTV